MFYKTAVSALSNVDKSTREMICFPASNCSKELLESLCFIKNCIESQSQNLKDTNICPSVAIPLPPLDFTSLSADRHCLLLFSIDYVKTRSSSRTGGKSNICIGFKAQNVRYGQLCNISVLFSVQWSLC